MRANIATGRLINFPRFHVDNFAQGLQTPGAAVITGGDKFAVFLFSPGQLLFTVQPGGFILQAVFKSLL
ncbi:hypothetical protein D3C87_2151440 [compost metagenome]